MRHSIVLAGVGLLGFGCTAKTVEELDDTGTGKQDQDCVSEVVTPAAAMRLTEHSGCGDFIFFSISPESDLLLYLRVNGPVAQANEERLTISTQYTIPDGGVTLNLQVGTELNDTVCTDDINGEAAMTNLYAANSGQLSLVVEPDLDDTAAWGRGGSVDVSLSGVTFVDEAGCDIALPTILASGIAGGVFPGG